jgi:hypothetical protein
MTTTITATERRFHCQLHKEHGDEFRVRRVPFSFAFFMRFVVNPLGLAEKARLDRTGPRP